MQSQQGKTIMITGATDGLGKTVAHHLAEAGATLILHGRSPEKGEALISEIKSTNPDANVHYYNADLASLAEVKALSEQVIQNHDKINVLINNAGVGGGPKGKGQREVSKDGFELRFAVNYLAHYLLTEKLLPIIKKSGNGRIVFVSSVGQAPIDFNDLMSEKDFDSYTAYCRSKLAQIIYGFDLAEQLKHDNVMVNSLHPATLMPTNMVNDFYGYSKSSIEDGAKVVELVAVSEETENITGAYFNKMKISTAIAQAYDKNVRERLHLVTVQLMAQYL